LPNSGPDAQQIECLRELVRWFDAEKVPGVVVGGMAVNLLGRERATKDVDALVYVDDGAWAELVASAKPYGFVSRLRDPLELAAKVRVIPLVHSPTFITVDIILGALPFEREVIRRSIRKKARGIEVPLPMPADLVVMKIVASRPHDLGDVEGVLDKNPRLSIARVRRIVRELAVGLDLPDLVQTLEDILRRRRKKR
jgi:Nucleotidyltransferase of unknown function (DUF6036)